MNTVLRQRLIEDFPNFVFKNGKRFSFKYPKTITIGAVESFDDLLALHEVSHAILGHQFYNEDLERVKMESQAWEKAKELATKYNVEINEDLIQDELDSYRDWLHKRSRCPACGLTRYQTTDKQYHCPRCESFS